MSKKRLRNRKKHRQISLNRIGDDTLLCMLEINRVDVLISRQRRIFNAVDRTFTPIILFDIV